MLHFRKCSCASNWACHLWVEGNEKMGDYLRVFLPDPAMRRGYIKPVNCCVLAYCANFVFDIALILFAVLESWRSSAFSSSSWRLWRSSSRPARVSGFRFFGGLGSLDSEMLLFLWFVLEECCKISEFLFFFECKEFDKLSWFVIDAGFRNFCLF